jgi:hypothetical protein
MVGRVYLSSANGRKDRQHVVLLEDLVWLGVPAIDEEGIDIARGDRQVGQDFAHPGAGWDLTRITRRGIAPCR